MKTRTLRPAGTRWEGRAVRFPENAARRSAESRGQGSLVPAPAGHIALRRDSRRRRLLLLGVLPAIRSAGRRGRSIPISAGSAAQSRSEPEAPRASSPAHPAGRRGAAIRMDLSSGLGRRRLLLSPREPPAPAAGVRCGSAGSGRSGSRRAARPRLRARRPFAPGSARARRRVRGHLPARARRRRREEGAVQEAGPSGRWERRSKLYLEKVSGSLSGAASL